MATPDHRPEQPTPLRFPRDHQPACGAGRAAVDSGQQPLHLTFDLQPLLIVLLVVLIRRLEDTRAAGHRQLLGVHVVLHLAQRATDEGGPLPGAGEHTRRGSGCIGGSILGHKEGGHTQRLWGRSPFFRPQRPRVPHDWVL